MKGIFTILTVFVIFRSIYGKRELSGEKKVEKEENDSSFKETGKFPKIQDMNISFSNKEIF